MNAFGYAFDCRRWLADLHVAAAAVRSGCLAYPLSLGQVQLVGLLVEFVLGLARGRRRGSDGSSLLVHLGTRGGSVKLSYANRQGVPVGLR